MSNAVLYITNLVLSIVIAIFCVFYIRFSMLDIQATKTTATEITAEKLNLTFAGEEGDIIVWQRDNEMLCFTFSGKEWEVHEWTMEKDQSWEF